MKAARLYAPGDIRLDRVADPEPHADEELIRVTAVGLCGSDRHWFSEGGIGDAVLERPLVLGHEIAGVIESGPRRGVRVAVDPAVPCGRCDLCANDLGHLCRELKFAGHGSTDGGLQSLMVWPQRLLAPIPDSISDDEAALLEPLGVALHALDLAKIHPRMLVGVFGCGPIGLLTIRVLRQLGVSQILTTDPLAARRDAALAAGASDVRESAGDAHWPELDVVIEVSGADGAVHDAVGAVRPGGRIVLVGIPSSDQTSFQASSARRKGLTILLSRRMRAADLTRAIALAATGELDLRSLITTRYPLDRVAEAFDALARYDGLKVLIEPQS